MLPNRETPLSDINITPLVDVMLVLLVIFMVTAPALTRTLSLNLPINVPVPPTPVPEMTMQVQAGDMYTLDGQAMTKRELDGALRTAVAMTPDLKLILDVDPNAEYASAVTAMATVRGAGVEAIALVEH